MIFPIDAVLPSLLDTLRQHPAVVLSAEPGAGKTTRVPIALLNEAHFSGGKILMLEPRRLAAIRSAEFMAQQLGEVVGQRVGYRIRGESKVSAATRIEVVTEGILTRLLQDDPALEDVSVLIFDEFHERSIHADFGLALALESQESLRPDLRLLVMSATLDGVAVSALMNDAPIIASEGRCFPVDTFYAPLNERTPMESGVGVVVVKALRQHEGDVLVFLPGQREIRRCAEWLQHNLTDDVVVHSLFGEASVHQQQLAIKKDAAGRRKIILATAIAETSLTIDGVRIVVDSGLARVSRFDPKRGMSGLVTTNVSQATSEQRRGRAGRTQSGVCYRLWSETQQQSLAKFPTPELLSTDLAPFALEMARWGVADAKQLRLLDQPPSAHLQQAQRLLQQLGALHADNRITEHGKAMAMLPVHPRFAHMLIVAKTHGHGALACDVCALLEERDILRGQESAGQFFRNVDFHERWLALTHGGAIDRGARERARAQQKRLMQLLKIKDENRDEDYLGVMIALAYPERLCKQRAEGSLNYQSAAGVGLSLPEGSALAKQRWLAVAEVDGVGSNARIFLAATLTETLLRQFLHDQVVRETQGDWDDKSQSVVARDIERLGALILSEQIAPLTPEAKRAAVIKGIRSLGLSVLHWSDKALNLKTRVEWLRSQSASIPEALEHLPDMSEAQLLATLEQWLAPYLNDVSRRSHLQQFDVYPALAAMISYESLRWLEQMAPQVLTVPTGTSVVLDYSLHPPVLSVRLQEMFGQLETPTVLGGKLAVTLHLLSPAKRPLAVTQDLRSFWQNAWADVRKDMRGQYPRHYWPENPLEAEPTKRTKAADDRAKKLR